MLLLMLTGWLERREREALTYLIEENRLLRRQLGHFRRAVAEFVAHYHRERNHQGLGNELIAGTPARDAAGHVSRRSRLGGLLNYYDRAA